MVLHAGESIQYVIASAKDKVKDWRVMPLVLAVNYGEYDPKKYLELLERAYFTIVEGLTSPTHIQKVRRKLAQLCFHFSVG